MFLQCNLNDERTITEPKIESLHHNVKHGQKLSRESSSSRSSSSWVLRKKEQPSVRQIQ